MISGHVSWSGCNSGREGRVLLDRETPGRPDSNNTHTSHLQQRLTDTVVNEAAHIIPLEFILECRGLVAMTAKDRVPRALVQVSVVNTHTHTLTHHCCTEIAEGSRDPVFLTGVCFHDNQAVYWDTRMKLTVYHYKDPAHNTRMFLGFTSFSIRDLFLSQEPSISLSLRTQDGVREVGEVKVSRLQMQELQDGEREDTSTCLPGHKCPLLCDCLHGSIHDTDNSPMMRAALRNTLCKVYRFQTEAGVWMLVREQMSESSLSFSIPKQLLALLIQQHMKRVQELEDLGDLSPQWEGLMSDVIAYHSQLITSYQATLTQLNTHTASSPCFKPSTSRTDRHLQFVPVNLHVQRMQVTSPGNTGVWYEVITVGAAADHSQGFKHGGLQRLLSARSVGVSSEQSSRARELLGSVAQLRPLLCGQAEELLQASLELCSSLLLRALDRLAATTGQFVHVLKDDLVRSSLLALHTTSPAQPSDGPASVTTGNGTLNRQSSYQVAAPSLRQRDSTHQDMEYDEEDWDRVWANVAKSLNCIVAMVDRLQERDHTPQEVTSEGSTDNTKNTGWRDQLLPLVVTLQDCVGEAEAWARPAVTAFLLQGEHRCCPGAPITQRRDAVFSQALSALVCGVCLRVYSGLQDQLFLQQLHLQGVLVQYEGLLSTYGDEQGILEDMEVGVMDLNRVSFSLSLATSDLPCSMQPCLSSPRGDDIVVQVPLPPDAFAALPWELRDGQLVRVHPVFFNIGINQQQSLAERFGDSSVQDRINMRSFELLKVYYNTLKKTLPSVCGVEVEQVEEVLVSLQVSLQSKRRKNTDVLWLAAQVCRALRGVRLTSCKSAKDRTSMSVTLEQVRVLSQQHNLSPQHFPHALDCMRREGCRMENVQKNICSRKYAFNSVQLLTFPRLYRPPEGTYGRAAS